MRVIFAIYPLAVYTDFPRRLYIVFGPWAISVGPWSRTSLYGNGSHWHSGWHRWRDEVLDP